MVIASAVACWPLTLGWNDFWCRRQGPRSECTRGLLGRRDESLTPRYVLSPDRFFTGKVARGREGGRLPLFPLGIRPQLGCSWASCFFMRVFVFCLSVAIKPLSPPMLCLFYQVCLARGHRLGENSRRIRRLWAEDERPPPPLVRKGPGVLQSAPTHPRLSISRRFW